MFFKNKLDPNLRSLLLEKNYKDFRVIIKCNNFIETICKKIKSYKGNIINICNLTNTITAKVNYRAIDRLLEYPEVKKIVLDEYLFLCGTSVASANKIYNKNNLKFSGKGITIALIDSGVYPHTDLISPNNRITKFTDLINSYSFPYDDNGHGTSISGVICGNGEKSNGLYSGIASQAELVVYKAFDGLGKGYASDVIFSIESIIEDSKTYNIRVLCLPFEQLNYNSFILEQFNYLFNILLQHKIIPVVPSGSNLNNAGSLIGISTLSNCITVGGVDTTSLIKEYPYSSIGPFGKLCKPNLVSAAVNIYSLNSDKNFIPEKDGIKLFPSKLDQSYSAFSGTSYAAAYVAAIIALLFEENKDLSFNDILSSLKLACDSLELGKNIEGDGFLKFSKLFS